VCGTRKSIAVPSLSAKWPLAWSPRVKALDAEDHDRCMMHLFTRFAPPPPTISVSTYRYFPLCTSASSCSHCVLRTLLLRKSKSTFGSSHSNQINHNIPSNVTRHTPSDSCTCNRFSSSISRSRLWPLLLSLLPSSSLPRFVIPTSHSRATQSFFACRRVSWSSQTDHIKSKSQIQISNKHLPIYSAYLFSISFPSSLSSNINLDVGFDVKYRDADPHYRSHPSIQYSTAHCFCVLRHLHTLYHISMFWL
jgi:hypothetical protein